MTNEIELGAEPEAEQLGVLERKYQAQMRQIVSQKIELPISTLPGMLKEQINLSPDFQRRNRWDTAKRSRFIESIIMNVPIPPIFLGEDEYGTYVVLDGRQRLTAISEFLNNTYKLRRLEVWAELNGLSYNDLAKQGLDKTITRRFIPAVVVLKESSPQVKYDVFDRLNTGGVEAEPMEIRNAVFHGKFNKTLHSLSEDATYRRLWDIPLDPHRLEQNALYSTMRDLELLLRFFALRDYESITLRFQDYLSDYMDQRNREYEKSPNPAHEDRRDFHYAVSNAWRVFGAEAFRRPQGDKWSAKSAPLADAIMVVFSRIEPDKIDDGKASAIRKETLDLMNRDQQFLDAITKGTNGKGAIKTRIEKLSEVVMRLV